jgi:hypothetical protein
MSAAKITSDAKVTQLDQKSAAEEQVTPQDAGDTIKLAKLLTRILATVTRLARAWNPKRIDFEDQVSTGTDASPQSISFNHSFGGRVRWWIVDAYSTGSIVLPLVLKDNTLTTANTLVLNVYYPMTFTLRVEEAG